MRKHVLFFVHGMGAYVNAAGEADHTWSQDAAAALKEQYDKYAFVRRKPFEERFEVIHINYDTEIFKLVKRWQTESQGVLSTAVLSAEPAGKLVRWLDGGAELDDNFAWTHAACVILYAFFPLMRQRLKVHVANQIQQALAPNAEGAVSTWSIIAHSLGTIVVHDVLHAMDSTTPNQAGISILDTMVPSAQVVAMMANVSKVLESTESPVYDGLVVPQSMIKNQSCCFSYFNCNNVLDPFVQPERFMPPETHPAWALARANGTYVDIEIRNVHDLNVHSLRNYLVNPAVHIPLLEYLVGSGSITDEEKATAMQFENISTTILDTARQELEARVRERLSGERNLAQWCDLAGVFFSALRRMHA